MRIQRLLFAAFLVCSQLVNSQFNPSNTNSLEFTGSNFVSVPDNNQLDLNTNTTFEGWFNFCSEGMIFSKNYCNYQAGYYLFVEPTGSIRLLSIYDNVCNNGISLLASTPGTYSFNQWHHFALTVSQLSGNCQYQLFMDHNPVPVINQTMGWVANNNTEPLRIGAYRNISGSLALLPQGRMSDFRVYDHVVPFNNQCLANPVSTPFLRLEMQSGAASNVPNTGSLSASLSGTNLNTGNSPITPNYLTTSPLFDPTIQTTGPFSTSDSPVQLVANSSGGTWSSNCGSCLSAAGVFNPQTAGAGTYQICYSVGSGVCAAQDCQTIVVTECSISVEASSTNESCQNMCDGTAAAVISGGTAPFTILWSNNASTSNISNLCSGNYDLTVTDNIGCSANASVTILAGLTGSDATIQTTGPFPETDQPTYFAANSGGGTWSSNCGACMSPNGLFEPQIAGPGTYQICYSVGTGACADQDCQTIVVFPCSVSVQTTSTSETCKFLCDGTASSTIIGGTAPFTTFWTNGATSPNISSLCPGALTVTVTDDTGCSASAIVNIAGGFTPPDVTIQTMGPFSPSDSPVQFEANSPGGTWSSNCGTCISTAGVFNPQTAGTGTYQICYANVSGLCPNQDCIKISVTCAPQTTSESHSICPGNTYTFNGQNFTDAGAYPFQFTDQNGCDSTHTLDLSVFQVNQTYQTITPCEGDSILVEGNWYFESDTVVTVFIDGNGCPTTHTTQILVKDCTVENYEVFIPNIFTPNDDNVNDVYSIRITGGYLEEGFILNRWGNIIKKCYENDLKWDGKTSEGTFVSEGVYTYIFVVRDLAGLKTKYTGFITVFR
ncbi:MAG: gliding motility-associated C-terminal domain-containing protein [Fluviicola sp.]